MQVIPLKPKNASSEWSAKCRSAQALRRLSGERCECFLGPLGILGPSGNSRRPAGIQSLPNLLFLFLNLGRVAIVRVLFSTQSCTGKLIVL
jgi:hypothetical protein